MENRPRLVLQEIDSLSLLETATDIQHRVFPRKGYDAYQNYKEALELVSSGRYWLVWSVEENCFVGVSGIYLEPSDNESAWLAWFGILPEFRRRGYASEALRLFEEAAIARGFSYVRLYTDADNLTARQFYEKHGYTGELYRCEEDPVSFQFDLCVYSKPLPGHPAKAWGQRNLHLQVQFVKQAFL
jgi:ribosomal protein S18 acetylase RimI-like enzyme